jgi:hypothetical protein
MQLTVDLFSDEAARNEVVDLKRHKVDYVEADTTLTAAQYTVIADAAKREALPLVGRIPAAVAERRRAGGRL